MLGLKVAYVKDEKNPIIGDLVKLKAHEYEEYNETATKYSITIRSEYGAAVYKFKDVELRHIIFLADYASFLPNASGIEVMHSPECHGKLLSLKQSENEKCSLDIKRETGTDASIRDVYPENIRFSGVYAGYKW